MIVLAVGALLWVVVNDAILVFSPIALCVWAALSRLTDAPTVQHS